MSEASRFVVHDDGELTALQFVERVPPQSDYDVVRLDATGAVRWRRPGTGTGETLAALGSDALVAGSDSLAGTLSNDAGVLALYDADGDIRRENFGSEAIVLYGGTASDGFRMLRRNEPGGLEGTLEARSAP